MDQRGSVKNKILVIDSAKNQGELYRLILEDAGYEVVTAQDGEQALSLARENYFDLVLTDDKATDTSGLLFAVDLVKQNPSAFVLLITTGSEKTLTHGSAEAIGAALRGARFGYLEKPVDLSLLLRMIDEVIALE